MEPMFKRLRASWEKGRQKARSFAENAGQDVEVTIRAPVPVPVMTPADRAEALRWEAERRAMKERFQDIPGFTKTRTEHGWRYTPDGSEHVEDAPVRNSQQELIDKLHQRIAVLGGRVKDRDEQIEDQAKTIEDQAKTIAELKRQLEVYRIEELADAPNFGAF